MELAPAAACCLLTASVLQGFHRMSSLAPQKKKTRNSLSVIWSGRVSAGRDGEQRPQVPPGDLPEDRGVPADREGTAGGETDLGHPAIRG